MSTLNGFENLLIMVADQAFKTIITIVTSAIVGGLGWLITLNFKSRTIQALISNPNRTFRFHYRGNSGGNSELNKIDTISFNNDGSIKSEMNSTNERYWKIKYGRLEIYSTRRILYSKFSWDKEAGKLVHVNDPKLPSVMGQYMVPLFIPPNSSTTNIRKK